MNEAKIPIQRYFDIGVEAREDAEIKRKNP